MLILTLSSKIEIRKKFKKIKFVIFNFDIFKSYLIIRYIISSFSCITWCCDSCDITLFSFIKSKIKRRRKKKRENLKEKWEKLK